MSLDNYLLKKLDEQTTKLQKRGISLTSIHVAVAGTSFVTTTGETLIRGHYQWLPVPILMWGGYLWFTLVWANKNHDYFESIKKTEKLNMDVMKDRELTRFIRVLWLFYFAFFMPLAILDLFWFGDLFCLLSIIQIISLPLMYFLNGCFFVGPGEFVRQKRYKYLPNVSWSGRGN